MRTIPLTAEGFRTGSLLPFCPPRSTEEGADSGPWRLVLEAYSSDDQEDFWGAGDGSSAAPGLA